MLDGAITLARLHSLPGVEDRVGLRLQWGHPRRGRQGIANLAMLRWRDDTNNTSLVATSSRREQTGTEGQDAQPVMTESSTVMTEVIINDESVIAGDDVAIASDGNVIEDDVRGHHE
jgi:hypothetical protein